MEECSEFNILAEYLEHGNIYGGMWTRMGVYEGPRSHGGTYTVSPISKQSKLVKGKGLRCHWRNFRIGPETREEGYTDAFAFEVAIFVGFLFAV